MGLARLFIGFEYSCSVCARAEGIKKMGVEIMINPLASETRS